VEFPKTELNKEIPEYNGDAAGLSISNTPPDNRRI